VSEVEEEDRYYRHSGIWQLQEHLEDPLNNFDDARIKAREICREMGLRMLDLEKKATGKVKVVVCIECDMLITNSRAARHGRCRSCTEEILDNLSETELEVNESIDC
jgi:hypothetical protein